MSKDRQNETAWTRLAEEKENRQPTPPIGEPLVWYIEGDKNRPVAAQCNGIEGPGRIKVVVFPLNAFPQHKAGCYHISHRNHERPNITTKNGGAWDYPRGKAPKEDFQLFDSEIEKRENSLAASEVEAEKNRQLFEKKQAEREAGIKKRLPDPLVVNNL